MLPTIDTLRETGPTLGLPMPHAANATRIVSTLAAFKIPATVERWNAGPVVTQYEIVPAAGVKLSRIETLAADLALALEARSIRIEAPIPGKRAVGVEIPNLTPGLVTLRSILGEPIAGGPLTFALGRDVTGAARCADLTLMPHLLIAGATGSGKSVAVNALIASLLMRAEPTELRLMLVDMKRVELAAYEGIPHLLTPIITEPEAAHAALDWAVLEMERRYSALAAAGARNIAGYNVDAETQLPYIVIVVDELADLIMRDRKIEQPIVRLAQKARATGIHLVIATQRPSVDVVTGLIKANFPSRIAFAMASMVDSRTVLDVRGAESLVGRGDMLYQPVDLPRPVRLQGVYVSDAEITAVVDHWRAEEPATAYDLTIATAKPVPTDPLVAEAALLVQNHRVANTALLQRSYGIGYARASTLLDDLEAVGAVGPFDGTRNRTVIRQEPVAEAHNGWRRLFGT